MLASRLAWEKKVVVLLAPEAAPQGPLTETAARQAASALKADLVLFGSLTALGNSISVDMKLMDLSGEKPVRTFFARSQSLNDVIPKIDLLAARINRDALGRTVAKKASAPPSASPRVVDESRIHPEKLIQGGFQDTGGTGQTDIFAQSAGVMARARFWKSPNFTFLINGLSLGDVTGNGKPEIVVATPTAVRIFSKTRNRFREIQKIVLGRFISIVGVDAADINGNGVAEIFVSALNMQKNAARSLVLEYNGARFVRIVEKSPWFYRIVGKQTKNPILLGQRIKIGDAFSGAITEMGWDGKGYVKERTLANRAKANLMGFARGDVQNNGQSLYLAYDPNDHILLMDASGKVLWKDADRRGGSSLYTTLATEEPGVENIRYLPMRLAVFDLDQDGKTEVIAAKNHEITGGLLKRFRVYTKSRFQFLSWDGIGLSLLRETRSIAGFVRDFFLGDFDGDGNAELVAAVVMKEGSLAFTRPKSAIIAYDLGIFKKP